MQSHSVTVRQHLTAYAERVVCALPCYTLFAMHYLLTVCRMLFIFSLVLPKTAVSVLFCLELQLDLCIFIFNVFSVEFGVMLQRLSSALVFNVQFKKKLFLIFLLFIYLSYTVVL